MENDEKFKSENSNYQSSPNFRMNKSTFRKKRQTDISIEHLFEGILNKDRSLLARSITLIESNSTFHSKDAQKLIKELLPFTGNSIRIGITGVPGSGKSTFIEALGQYLCEEGLTVAVMAVDPSSTIGGGSILGDKTRMEKLARNPKAFIRPSPSGGSLGGVHQKTRETILLCEAFGFDVILVETVGVGQSEVMVREMVDFFAFLVLTGAGDDLQGMKKGIMELADAIIINKADGENKALALQTKKEYNQLLHFLQDPNKAWRTKAFICSSLFKEGIVDIWNVIKKFESNTKGSGIFLERRRLQTLDWMRSMIISQLKNNFFRHSTIRELIPIMENEVLLGKKTVKEAVDELFIHYL